MNKLSNIVIDFARTSEATKSERDHRRHRVEARLPVCRWRRDRATGRLICVWAATVGAREAEPPLRRSLAA